MLKGQEGEGERRGEGEERKKNTNNKMSIATYLSIIILNVNGLNAPMKTCSVAEWIGKQDLYICCL